ncbi:uncharacterized protein LOC135713031 [Ochlerotatus camptorhynchus]|uniref:uncharacterized protein LOC135713031 n=1 Tax=Ochlerotatus camptorhynchus TaxID=644619 RepID=UPI0031E3F700
MVSNSDLDREEIREKDALSKLNSKKYADSRRGAKESDISVGDKVLITQQKRLKSDPTFSAERYTIMARDGAKIVVRSGRGVQYSRNVQDVKLASTICDDFKQLDESAVNEHLLHESQDSDVKPEITTRDVPDNSAQPAIRPKRSVGKPSKFKDMVLYRIFE